MTGALCSPSPLFHDDITTEDFIEELDSIYQVDDEGFITLVYHGTLLSTGIEDYIEIPDQAIGDDILDIELPPGIDSAIVINDHTIMKHPEYQFTVNNGAELKLVRIKSGSMKIDFTSDFRKSGMVYVEIPAMSKAGQPFMKAYPFDYTGTLPVRETYFLNLSGYEIDLTDSNTTYNSMEGEYRVMFYGNNEFVHRDDDFRIDVTVSDPMFSFAQGYLGQIQVDFQADSVLCQRISQYNSRRHVLCRTKNDDFL